MVTFTTNKNFGLPAVGGDAGVWGPPLNNNSSIMDASLGGTTTISVSSLGGSLVLSSSNYNNVFWILGGTLTQNLVLFVPSGAGSFWCVSNSVSNPTSFTVQIQSLAGGAFIGLPPQQFQDIVSDGVNVSLRNLPPVGTYWDFIGSAVPNWVSACQKPPYLYCNGSAFSGATYPYLAAILGGTTLPDLRGRSRAAFNDGTGRITAGGGGVDGNTILSAGGVETVTLSGGHMPPVPYIDPGHSHFTPGDGGGATTTGLQGTTGGGPIGGQNSNTVGVGITIGNASPAAFTNLSPMTISGITMVRAG